MKPITIEKMLSYRFLSNLTASPDGDYAVFCLSECDLKSNGYARYLYTYRRGKTAQLTFGGGESTFCFEDEKHVLYIDAKSASAYETTLYSVDTNGGKPVQRAVLPLCVASLERISPEHYLVNAVVDVTRHGYYALSEEARQKVRQTEKENEDYQIVDEYPFCSNGEGFTNHQRNQLFLLDANSFAITPVCSQYMHVESFDVENGIIYYSGQDYRAFRSLWSQVYAYELAGGVTRTLYSGTDMCVRRVFHCGQDLIVAGSFGERYGAIENSKFYRLRDGEMTLWIDFDSGMYPSVGSDCRYGHCKSFAKWNGKPYFVSADNSAMCLYTIEDEKIVKEIGQEGTVDDFTVVDGALLVIGMYGSRLQELYEWRDRELKRCTDFNTAALEDCYVAVPKRHILHKAPFDIDGWVLEPMDYDPSKSYPAILDIHGGPKCLFGECFYHEMQVWASRGYFVFFCNPRGGDGKGNAFADLRGNYGHIDYEDIMDFTDEVLSVYPSIDRSRLAVTGGSYGGYMTNWIVGHTDRFCCAATQRSISNWITQVTTSDYGIDFPIEQQFSDRYHCTNELWDISPLKYANEVKTPLLFIHSFEDYRCPIDQGLQFYTALRCRGVDAKMVLFKGENHELSRSGKPKHRIKRLTEITAWIEKYTKEAQEK